MGTQSISAENRLAALGLELNPAPTPLGAYAEAVQTGNLLYLSGMLPTIDSKPAFVGKIGREFDVEQGREATKTATLNVLSNVRQALGSLDKVKRVVKLGVSLATDGDFRAHPKVADAGSELLRDVFGQDSLPVRLIYGVASLPLGVPVELEVIFEVEN